MQQKAINSALDQIVQTSHHTMTDLDNPLKSSIIQNVEEKGFESKMRPRTFNKYNSFLFVVEAFTIVIIMLLINDYGIADCNAIRKDVELRLNLNVGDYYSNVNPNSTTAQTEYGLNYFTTNFVSGPLKDPSTLDSNKTTQFLQYISGNQDTVDINTQFKKFDIINSQVEGRGIKDMHMYVDIPSSVTVMPLSPDNQIFTKLVSWVVLEGVFSEEKIINDTERKYKTFIKDKVNQSFIDDNDEVYYYTYDENIDSSFNFIRFEGTDIKRIFLGTGAQLQGMANMNHNVVLKAIMVFYNPMREIMIETKFFINQRQGPDVKEMGIKTRCYKPYGSNSKWDTRKSILLCILIFKIASF